MKKPQKEALKATTLSFPEAISDKVSLPLIGIFLDIPPGWEAPML